MSISIKHAVHPTETEIQEAAKVLHEAFKQRYFLSALGGDATLVEPFLLAHVRATIVGGQLYIAQLADGRIVGVALWFGPGQKFLSSVEQRNEGWNQTMEALDEACQKWWDNFLSLVDTVTDRLYGPGQQLAAYHLQTFGVLPDHQKKGYGMALLSAVEAKVQGDAVEGFRIVDLTFQAKLTSTDVVVETMGECNVPIYKKLGFEVLGPEAVKTPAGGQQNAYCFRKRTSSS